MQHSKFRGNRTIGSGEKDILRVFTIYRTFSKKAPVSVPNIFFFL